MAATRDQHVWISENGEEQPPPGAGSGTYFVPVKPLRADMGSEYLGRVTLYFTLCGLAFLLVGAIAVGVPLIFSGISVPDMVAWLLVIGGVFALLHFLLEFGAPGTTSFLLLGVLHLGIGLWLLIQASIRSGNTFVWLIMGWFLVHGLFKLLLAFQMRSLTSWPALVVSAIASIILGVLSIILTPSYGLTFVGVLFGVDLAVTGISFFLISFVAYLTSRAASSREPLLLEQKQEQNYAAASSA